MPAPIPDEADRFDVVFAESVLIFVEDKAQAIRECVRVAKPGGYVGLNEGLWIKQPSPEMVVQVKDAIGPFIPTDETWQALWEASGLWERVVKVCHVDARTEVKSRSTVDRLAVASEGLGSCAAPVHRESCSQAIHEGDV